MLNLAGEQGQTLANEGVDEVRKVIKETPPAPPPGVQAYVAGPAALTDDLHVIGNASLAMITLITLAAIAGMLLIVYRSIRTTLIQLFLTFLGLLTARGVVSILALHGAFGLTTFAGNILTMLAIAAATDYGIFIFGRYREDRGMGLDRDESYYATFKSVAPPSSWFRPDNRRSDVLPVLRATAVLHHHGRARRDRHARDRGDRGHARPCRALPGQPRRSIRVEATAAEPLFLAARWYRRGPLARTDFFRRQPVRGPHRHRGNPPRLQARLQRPLLPSQ